MAHFLIGFVKCATNEKILRFISLVHHLSRLNHLKYLTIFQYIGATVLGLEMGLELFFNTSSPLRLIRDGYRLAQGVGHLSRGPFISKMPKRPYPEPSVGVLT